MRVVGGNVTNANEFPWLAGLSKNGEFYCGATLITRKHLLTAAHCVYKYLIELYWSNYENYLVCFF